MNQCRLAGSRFSDQHGNALARKQTVLERAQRLAMLSGQKQIPRIRRQFKRQLAKTVEMLIHDDSAESKTDALEIERTHDHSTSSWR